MSRADRAQLVADLKRAGVLGRAKIVDEAEGFRLKPIALNGSQAKAVRAALIRVADGYANVCVGNAALTSLP